MKENQTVAKGGKCAVRGWQNRIFNIPHVGVVFAIIASLFYCLIVVFAKLITVPPLHIALYRCYLQYIILIPVILRGSTGRIDYIVGHKKARIFLLTRGLSGSLAGIFLYLSVQHLPAGSVVTLTFLDIIFVPILGRLFYKESFTIFDALFALVAFSGVVLIAKPAFLFSHLTSEKPENAIGVVYGILSALCAAMAYVVVRKLGKSIHYLHVTFYYTIVGLAIANIVVPITEGYHLPCQSDLIFIILMTVSALLGVVTVTLALQNERAGTVAVLLTPQIIFVYVIQLLILHDVPSPLSLVGSFLIFSTSVCIGIRKIWNGRKRKRSKTKDDG